MKVSVGGWSGFGRAVCLTALIGATAHLGLAGDVDYRTVLEVLGQTGPESAVSLLIESLPATMGEAVEEGWESRRQRELQAAEALVGGNADVLLPIIDLHDRAHLELGRRGDVTAANQERVTAYLLSDLYAQQELTDRMRQTAADLFAILAGNFHQSSPGPTAADLYRRALRLDMGNAAALSGLSHILESQGRYREALPYLELHFAVDPQRRETQLRRAINLGRVGRLLEASYGFFGLLSDSSPDWIAAVAVQELARMALAEGDLHEAKRIVDLGLTRSANEPTLIVIATYIDERLFETPVEGSMSRRLVDAAGSDLTASRYRYAEWSPDLVEEARDRLRLAADLARPDLVDSLLRGTPSGATR